MRIGGVKVASAIGMQIRLVGVDVDVTDRIRAYAEYRFFTSTARHAPLVRSVEIALKPRAGSCGPNSNDGGFLCQVSVDLGASGRIKTQARGPHPSAAIDRAANRAAWLLSRRSRQTPLASQSPRAVSP